jgi:DNA-binding MarR family transcriptional regulator
MLAQTSERIDSASMGSAETRPAEAPPSEAALDQAWRAFLIAHSRLTRALDDELGERHGFALGDFDVLARLGEAPSGRLRMCDLAAAVVLSPSGLSRRVDRLERAGYVTRERAEDDARNVEARLTPSGKRLLGGLRETHRAAVKQRFADRFSAAELEALGALLGRLAGSA